MTQSNGNPFVNGNNSMVNGGYSNNSMGGYSNNSMGGYSNNSDGMSNWQNGCGCNR